MNRVGLCRRLLLSLSGACAAGVFVAMLSLANSASAQELYLDLKLEPAESAGSVVVELFPARSDTVAFQLTVSSENGERRTYETSETAMTLPGLVSGRTYTVKAMGLSAAGRATEISPDESVVAP